MKKNNIEQLLSPYAKNIAAILLSQSLALPCYAIILDDEPAPAPKPVKAKPSKSEDKPKTSAESRSCSDCPVMLHIPGGTFMMGSSSAEQDRLNDAKPRHEVHVSSFSLGKYEVTRQQFGAFVDDTGYSGGSSCYTLESGKLENRDGRNWQNPSFPQGNNHPVVCVNVADAEAYIRWLNTKTGKNYRLPTEAEWEYAARGGTDTAWYWGDEADAACRYANVADQTAGTQISYTAIHNCSDGYVYTAPVGSFQPNHFGLQDMLGNVLEWTCSAYTESGYDGSEKTCTNYVSYLRVFRGGSWGDSAASVRSAFRGVGLTSTRHIGMGFRLAQDN